MVLERFFHLSTYGTNLRTEVIAGLTTFMTMSYIIIVNPLILADAGMPFGAVMTATILSAIIGCFLMGFYANRPFALAPYMGANVFMAYTVCGVLGYSWQTALGAVFISGILLFGLTVVGARTLLTVSVPENLKYAFVAGIGLFISYVGLVNTGIVARGNGSDLLAVGTLSDPLVLLAIFGFFVTMFMMIRRINGAFLVGILATAILGFALGLVSAPAEIVSIPPSVGPVAFQLDIFGALTLGMFPVILAMFMMDFLFTMSGVIGVSSQAGLLDEQGNLPEIEKPFIADSLATIFGALLGTTTVGTFLESGAGTAEGGRTGLVAVIVALLFALGLLFSPLFSAIPAVATGPALILIGILMLKPLAKIDFDDYTELIPAFMVIVLMIFTANIGVGLCGGFVLFPVAKVIGGRWREVHWGAWVLFVFCLLFFIFYPY